MSRADAIAHAERHFDSGAFKRDLARLVAMPTESQNPGRAGVLAAYLEREMMPMLTALGFSCHILANPKAKGRFCSPSASRTRASPPSSGTATAT